jgi:hypothetical protein
MLTRGLLANLFGLVLIRGGPNDVQMQSNLFSGHSVLQNSDRDLCSTLSLLSSKPTKSNTSLTVAEGEPESGEQFDEVYEWMELVGVFGEQQLGGDTRIDKALRCVLTTHILFGKEARPAPGRAPRLISTGMARDGGISLRYWDKLVPKDKTARMADGSSELLLSAVRRKRIGSIWNIYAAR